MSSSLVSKSTSSVGRRSNLPRSRDPSSHHFRKRFQLSLRRPLLPILLKDEAEPRVSARVETSSTHRIMSRCRSLRTSSSRFRMADKVFWLRYACSDEVAACMFLRVTQHLLLSNLGLLDHTVGDANQIFDFTSKHFASVFVVKLLHSDQRTKLHIPRATSTMRSTTSVYSNSWPSLGRFRKSSSSSSSSSMTCCFFFFLSACTC